MSKHWQLDHARPDVGEAFSISIFRALSGGLSAGIGLLVLFGWIADIPALKTVLPDYPSMKFNTALCFLFLGLGVLFPLEPASNAKMVLFVKIVKSLVLFIAAATLAQYFFSFSLGLDELFVSDSDTPTGSFPGRMSRATASGFLLLGSASLFQHAAIQLRWIWDQILAAFTLIVSAAAIIGYIYGLTDFQFQFLSTMAIHTSLLMMLLAAAVLFDNPQGLARLFSRRYVGGRIARILLPLVFIIPVILGWLSYKGFEYGYYSLEFGFAVGSLGAVLFLSALLLLSTFELNRAESHLQLILESSVVAKVMIDSSGEIVMVNKRTESMFNYSRDKLLGQKVEVLLPTRYKSAHPGMRNQFFSAPEARLMGEGRDLKGLRSDGTEFYLEIGIAPLTTPEGNFVLASVADIDSRKKAELELKAKTEELERSNRELEEFAYIASHDLQEPLRAVSGCVQLLEAHCKGTLDDKAVEFISHTVNGTKRMQNLIDDLLKYSRIGSLNEDKVKVQSRLLLDRALDNLQVSIEESGIQIEIGELPEVYVVPTKITMVFQNLVGNAIKFRSAKPRIRISAEREGDYWRFQFADNGIGIAPEYGQRIFEVFQRLHSIAAYEGTGIGLALCKKLITQHKGKIWVESEEGKGATFIFTLPISEK